MVSESDRRRRRRARARRVTGLLAMVAILAGLLALALAKVNISELGRALGHVRVGWIAAGAAFMCGAFLARAESWFAAIRAAVPDCGIGRATVTRAMLIGMAGNTVAPGRLGEAARAWLIARRTGGVRDGLAKVVGTLVAQTLLNVTALTLLAVIAVTGSALRGAHTEAIVLAAMLPLGIVLVLVLGPPLLGSAQALGPGPLGRMAGWLHRQLAEIRLGLSIARTPSGVLHTSSFQLGAWAMQLGTCYSVLLAFGLQHRTGIPAAAAVLLAVNVTAVLPLTPSNVGVFQAACIAVLAPFKIGAANALAYGIVLQAIEVASALALGIPALAHEGLSPAQLRRGASTVRE